MRFDIMTLFPELVERVLGESIIGRAREAGYTVVKAHNIRDYSEDKHRRVDDTPTAAARVCSWPRLPSTIATAVCWPTS